MRIWVRAEGEAGTGKSFILDKVCKLLELFGFEVFKQGEDSVNGGELLIMDREEDKVHFINGAKMIQLGEWIIELDINNQLVSAYHEGRDMFAREIEVNFAAGQITTIASKSIIKADSVPPPEDILQL